MVTKRWSGASFHVQETLSGEFQHYTKSTTRVHATFDRERKVLLAARGYARALGLPSVRVIFHLRVQDK